MTLDTVQVGDTVTVASISCARSTARRLMELGLLPGGQVSVSRVAPMGCPLELSVRGAKLSIRKAEAARISVTAGATQ